MMSADTVCNYLLPTLSLPHSYYLFTISIGFGVVNSGGNIPADILQEVTIPTISNEDEVCIEENGDRPANTCTFDPAEPLDRKDTCKGDSGGPSFVRLNNGDGTFKDVHIGITSFGTFGCSGTAVNARTSFSIDWVKSIVCEDPDGQDADFCQTASPSSSPTSSPSSFQASSPTCTDDPDFEANGKKCGRFLNRKRNRECKKIIDGTLVADSCPSLCKRSCSSCKNKSGKIKLKNGKRFNCKKIKKKKKCRKKTKAGPLANEFCPAACKIEGC